MTKSQESIISYPNTVHPPVKKHSKVRRYLETMEASDIPPLVITGPKNIFITNPLDVTQLGNSVFMRPLNGTVALIAYLFGGPSFATQSREKTKQDLVGREAHKILRETAFIYGYRKTTLSATEIILDSVEDKEYIDIHAVVKGIAAAVALTNILGLDAGNYPKETRTIVDGLGSVMAATGAVDGETMRERLDGTSDLLAYILVKKRKTLKAMQYLIVARLENKDGGDDMINRLLLAYYSEQEIAVTTRFQDLSPQKRREFVTRVTSLCAVIYTAAFSTVTTTMTDIVLDMDKFSRAKEEYFPNEDFDYQDAYSIMAQGLSEVKQAIENKTAITADTCPHWVAYFEWKLSQQPPLPVIGKEAREDTTIQIHYSKDSTDTVTIAIPKGGIVSYIPEIGTRVMLGKKVTHPRDFLITTENGVIVNKALIQTTYVFGLGQEQCKGEKVAQEVVPVAMSLIFERFFPVNSRAHIMLANSPRRRIGITATYSGQVLMHRQ